MWRKLLGKILGDYDLWRIFSINTADCRAPSWKLDLARLDDLQLFRRADLDHDLKKSDWSAPGAIGFVLRDGSEIGGVCWFWTGAALAGRNIGLLHEHEAELIQITIASRLRHRGLGSALIAETGIQMRGAGFTRLYAQVWHSNHASRRAFGNAGWTEIGFICRMRPPWLDRAIVFRRLAAHAQGNAALLPAWRRTSLFQMEA